jgi:hypothetical protein
MDPLNVPVAHTNFAIYLREAGGDWRTVLAHRLAALLLYLVMRSGEVGENLERLVDDLRRGGQPARSALPADFAALCAAVRQVEGVQFEQLMAQFSVDQASGDEGLREVIAKVDEIITSGGDR